MRTIYNTNESRNITEMFMHDVRTHMTNSAIHGSDSVDVNAHNSSTTSHADIRSAIYALQSSGGGSGDVATHNSATAAHADIRALITSLQNSLIAHNTDTASHTSLLLGDSALSEIITAYSGATVPTTLTTSTNNTKHISALQIAKLLKGLPTSLVNATIFDTVTIGVPYSAYNGARVDTIMPNTKFNSKTFVNATITGWDANTNYISSGYDTILVGLFVGPHDDTTGTNTFLYDWNSQPVSYSGVKISTPIKLSGIINGVSDINKNLKITIISRLCNTSVYLSNFVSLVNLISSNDMSNKTLAKLIINSSSDLNIVSQSGVAGFATDGLNSAGLINDYQVKFECISVNK